MKYRQTNDSANEFEVIEMFGVYAGMRIDLKGIIVVSGVFEQTVEWVEHLV